jgi:hypothetical protein
VSGSKDLRRALPPGYRLVPARKHLLVRGPDGELVRHADGRPMIVSKGGKAKLQTMRQQLRTLRELAG